MYIYIGTRGTIEYKISPYTYTMFKLFFGLFLSHLYIQHGVQTHNSADKGRLLHLLSHPGTLGVCLIFLF